VNATTRLISLIAFITLVMAFSTARASLVFLYDFPGNPGSGLAANQTSPQPTYETFSDFTRTNVTSVNAANVFASHAWSTAASLDPTLYEGFSITANTGVHIDLTSLTFNAYLGSAGPQNIEVRLFLNGSASAYATYDFLPTGTSASYTFNFTHVTTADNVSSATFSFYGWNAQNTGGAFYLGNVGTYSAVPEVPTVWPIILLICFILASKKLGLLAPRNRR
jgi:hypothetical protein